MRALGRVTLPADRAVVGEKVGFDPLTLLGTKPQSSQPAGEHLTRGASRPALASASLAEVCGKLQAHTAAHRTNGLLPMNTFASGNPHLDIKVGAAKNDLPLIARLSRSVLACTAQDGHQAPRHPQGPLRP